MSNVTVNPVVYEVIRSRLLASTEEMRIALQSVSGSPTVTEASDFFTGLFLPDGSFASMGFQVSLQAPVVGHLIRAVHDRPHLEVRDGDMFMGNDPFVGALHQNDLQLTGPIFADGQLIAWAGVEAHVTDIGGMDFASWSPRARDCRQEGLRIPCVKVVEEGRPREDILEMILTATRLPAQLGLDIRAFIATINVARSRIAELAGRYGAGTVSEVMRLMIAQSERRTRARLRELPDGIFRATDFLEHDGEANRLYKIHGVLEKRGETLRFDFSGSSYQAPGFINCTRSGLEGAVIGSVMPMLAWDIPWNRGILNCCEIVAPDGLVVTAQYPAPVGSATVEAIWTTTNVVSALCNRLLACSKSYAPRAQAVAQGTMATFNLGGRNQYGEPFGLHLMDPLAGGYGAFASKDGYDAGGPHNSPMASIADVERNERAVPLFYFYRRLARDTGGCGTFAGGASAELALTLAGVDEAEALIMTHGAEVPNTAGLAGGLPGATVVQRWAEQGASEGVLDAAARFEMLGPKPGLRPMRRGDVFAVSWQGGGGWGDPLGRDPDAVLRDLNRGVISTQTASEIYGVSVVDGALDRDSTEALRASIRQRRIGVAMPARTVVGEVLLPIGPALTIVRNAEGDHVIGPSGHVLSSGHTRWREGAVSAPVQADQLPMHVLHAELAMTAWYCPVSGILLALDIHRADETPQHDVEIDLAQLTAPTTAQNVA
ncbi:hydantoinase B/oxoprolinase family protein [Roseomonas sp. KE2513]|uniref:hydantoinase B/oxoprolinase family protein n=1 Tax=Roseomonas sp. KE2513 TaxID=2479202 RepID=UPI0018DF94BA|nr:hydantoinase B/oxoprolinase family protein [Roseomonas sp. KE2513]MBI0538785.1 hydantoinase B/oxoprolinase family protein [Roseomonas sp. KE2513]